ncbi:hypothetical protein SPRG_04772 [Saprolegnia parasitica CBS 223.65]|uniref:Kinesin-like protein n=1 Tax=Saprolegnia parasitica (strain CBS 223.65) TaxID=695850 RepID=A0A067CNQ4_SAPPC|nr:hypothetical protein SPRG_04772 [Saprolegnia parasitica CBS 223.65]KDO30870.1 hypothetical protein SPRG_04772 [Saprolegnia parasitica CBS 223.65]|eukprot:XP_012198565.1 hypothetical protein SPRG_04772 [Saprolegnia parasitica CBS 223.65]
MATSSKRPREAMEPLVIGDAAGDAGSAAPPAKSPNLGSSDARRRPSGLKPPRMAKSGLPVPSKVAKALSNQDENDRAANAAGEGSIKKKAGSLQRPRSSLKPPSAMPAPSTRSASRGALDAPPDAVPETSTSASLPSVAARFNEVMQDLGRIDDVAKPRRTKLKPFDYKGRCEEQRSTVTELRGLLRTLEEQAKKFELEAVQLDQAIVLQTSLAKQDLLRIRENEASRSDIVASLQAQIDELKHALDAAIKEKDAFQKQAHDVNAKLQDELASKVTLSTQRSQVTAQLEQLRAEHDLRVAALQNDKVQLEAQRDAAVNELALVRAQLTRKEEDASGTLKSMRDMQAFAMSTNERLANENKALSEKLASIESKSKAIEESSAETSATIQRLTSELEASEAAKHEAVALARESAEACAIAKAELTEQERIAFAEKGVRQVLEAQQRESQKELMAVYAESKAIRSEMERLLAQHGSDKAKFEADRLQLASEKAKAAHALAIEMEALREANVSLESELHTWKTKWHETQEHQNMVEMAALITAQREADVLKLRLKEATTTGLQTMEAKDAAIAELTAKVKEGEMLRRKLHNTIQELRGNVRVFARTRPFLPSDGPATESAIQCDVDGVTMKIKREKESHSFTFDRVFPAVTGQEAVFDEVSEFVQSAIDGYQVCLFSYGQTGSGKTHTMQGSGNGQMRGIIPRSIEKILDECSKNQEAGWRYTLHASFLEIYNEAVRDLLAKKEDAQKSLTIKMLEKHGGVTVPDLTLVEIHAVRDVEGLMERASRLRSVAATDMNEQSSRSHSVFSLYLKGTNDEQGVVLEGRLNLVDLAGSERISRSGATGERLKEAQAINKSLSALTDVFNAIALKNSHVPFRNSKLTYLLQSCLSGDGKTLMMVNLSPTIESTGESLCSLRFAHNVNMCELGKAKRQFKKKSDADA